MTERKWYITETYTDTECEVKVIDLTEEEYATIKRFLHNTDIVFTVAYPNTTMISVTGYDTHEDAIIAYETGEVKFR